MHHCSQCNVEHSLKKTYNVYLQVKHSAGKVSLDQGESDLAGSLVPTWLAYVAAARDRHEQTVEAIRDARGLVFYR